MNKVQGFANVGLIIGIVVVVAVGFFFYNQSSTDNSGVVTVDSNTRETAQSDEMEVEKMAEGEDAMADLPDSNMADDNHSGDTMAEETSTNKVGTYTDYDPALLANAESGPVLLFFRASWCPSCRALDKNVESNLSNIPGDVTIMTVNYDTETELKKKYGITRQHTLVQVDANGNQIKTLTGLTNTLDQVLAQI